MLSKIDFCTFKLKCPIVQTLIQDWGGVVRMASDRYSKFRPHLKIKLPPPGFKVPKQQVSEILFTSSPIIKIHEKLSFNLTSTWQKQL